MMETLKETETATRQPSPTAPSLSVVLAAHNAAEALERNLPLFLTQQYPGDYEVIVVDDASNDETPDVLKRLKAEHPCLYTTFIPPSPPNPQRHRLALTVGAKAARHEWVVLADIQCPPQRPQTYDELMQTVLAGDDQVTMLYSGHKEGEVQSYQSWPLLTDAAPLLRKAERHGGRGHAGLLMKSQCGQYDAVVVSRKHVHDLLKYFDQQLRGRRLMGTFLLVVGKNLLNRPVNNQQ